MKPCVPITIIIPTYNRKESLINTINSYLAGKVLPDEIIIVDQTIPALSIDDIVTDEQSNIILVHSDKPSLTRARNIGIKHSKNDIILFSDDDVLIDDNSISRFYNIMKKGEVALCAGISVNDHQKERRLVKKVAGTLIGMQCFWKTGGYVVQHTMRGRYALKNRVERYNTDWAMGYFFGVKKSLLNRWSVYFDEKLTGYAYAEDLDFSLRYCRRAKQEKYNCIIDKSIYVNHLATQEWRTPSRKAMCFLVANRLYLLYKNFPNYCILPMIWNNLCYSAMLPEEEGKYFRNILKICLRNRDRLRNGDLQAVYNKMEFGEENNGTKS